jgi:alpha-L-fucosidase
MKGRDVKLPPLFVSLSLLLVSTAASAQTLTMQQLLSSHIEQRFGMFIHYNMNTYKPGWGENRVDPKTFAPPSGDCHTFTDQWAKAAKSAGMKFGILTTKHHDGFSIWPSKAVPPTSSPYGTVPYTITQSAVPTMDVVKCYVDSFRAQGLEPDLYFSIWDPNNGIGSQAGHNTDPGPVDWSVVGNYITAQITELLTNYGNIPVLVFDGYAWLTGHQQIPYQKIRALVRQLQPNTIIVDHDGGVPWEVDVEYFEEPLGVTVPAGNTTAGAQGQTIAKDRNWFWRSTQAAAGYMTASDIAKEIKNVELNYTNFILDCPPNLQGVLETPVVTALGQVPQYWTPNTARAPLPQQLPKIEVPLTPVSATATSGSAALAIDGYNDSIKGVNNTMHSNKGESLWTSTGALPQSVTLNLGKSYDNIDMLEYLPQRNTGTTAGNITSYKVYVSTDGVTFTQVATGTWPADSKNGGLLSAQRVQFPARTAQYVRLEATAVAGGGTSAIIGEMAVGSSGLTGPGGAGGSGGGSGTGGVGGAGGTSGKGSVTGTGGGSVGLDGSPADSGRGGTSSVDAGAGGAVDVPGIGAGGAGGAADARSDGTGGADGSTTQQGSGGAVASGGSVPGVGGTVGSGGSASMGGAAIAGATTISGGTTASGGITGAPVGGSLGGASTGNFGGSSQPVGTSGCGCDLGRTHGSPGTLPVVLMGAMLTLWCSGTRRRSRASRCGATSTAPRGTRRPRAD